MSSRQLFTDHPRRFADFRFVYPVVSRRAQGVSLGVNLNPDKLCNFDCVYCQVDRRSPAETRFVEMDRLLDELSEALEEVVSGRLFRRDPFRHAPPRLQRLNDIAFSGDGEPTTYGNFDEIVAACAARKRRVAPLDVKMVLITNASMFHRPHVVRGLQVLDDNQGEIWAKLDAGTDGYFRLVERTPIPLRRILENITEASRRRPLVIQSLFLRLDGQGPPVAEIEAYIERLLEIRAAGGQLKLVQVYTVARPPAESYVGSLSDAEVDAIADRVRAGTGLPVAAFYGVSSTQPDRPQHDAQP